MTFFIRSWVQSIMDFVFSGLAKLSKCCRRNRKYYLCLSEILLSENWEIRDPARSYQKSKLKLAKP